MTRTLSAGQLTAIQAEHSASVYLLELAYWTGAMENTLRLTTAPNDIDADVGSGVVTWTGAGEFLAWGGITESNDSAAQAMQLSLDGVNQTITSILLSNSFRGRDARMWRAFVDEDTGAIDSVLLLFRGRQLGGYEWEETGDGIVTITTKVSSRLADLRQRKTIVTNEDSHNALLTRAGLSTGDTFFRSIGANPNNARYHWGEISEYIDGLLENPGSGITRL